MPHDLDDKKPTRHELSTLVRKFVIFIFALTYATTLACLPLEIFKDRSNYLVYAEVSDLILLGYASEGFLSFAANEPLWLLLNAGLANYFQPEVTLKIIIFIPAFITSFVLMRNNTNNFFWMVFILLIPLVIKNHVIHLRQGAAISLYMFGYFAKRRWLRVVPMGLSGFIHSSLLIIVAIGIITWTTRALRLSPALRIVFFLGCFLTLSIILPLLAGELGARQGEQYANASLDISGLGFVFWFLVLCLYISSGMTFVRYHSFSIAILLFYTAAYFTTPLAGRIFESGLLLVLLTGLSLTGWRKQVYSFAIMSFTVLLYLLRSNEPWLGWALT